MGLLSQLLPGLRDLRTPLTTGYAWLIGLWLLFADVPTVRDAGLRVWAQLVPLATAYGSPTILATTAIAAYLFGSLTSAEAARPERNLLESALLWPLARPSHVPAHPAARSRRLDRDDQRRLLEWVADKIGNTHQILNLSGRLALPARKIGLKEDFATESCRVAYEAIRDAALSMDPRAASIRLHIANKDLWDEYDRLTAEASLRLSLAAPVTVIAVGVGLDSAWFLGVIFGLLAYALFVAGDAKACSANRVLVQCLITEVIHDPGIDGVSVSPRVQEAVAVLREADAAQERQNQRRQLAGMEERRLWEEGRRLMDPPITLAQP